MDDLNKKFVNDKNEDAEKKKKRIDVIYNQKKGRTKIYGGKTVNLEFCEENTFLDR